MTAIDWLELLESEPRLFRQVWHIEPSGQIRNAKFQCPLCAWATLQNPAVTYTVAWKLAIREIFGFDWDDEGAACVADASDNQTFTAYWMSREVGLTREALLLLFNLKARS